MSFIVSILNFFRKFRKIKKKLKGRKFNIKHILILIWNSFYPLLIEISLLIVVVVILIYSVTGAVGELFNALKNMSGSSSYDTAFYDSLTDAQLEELSDTYGASLNPKKISKYINKANQSVSNTISGTKIIQEGKNGLVEKESKSTVTVDTSKYANLYRLNWEFIAAIDLANFTATEMETTTAIDNANKLFPEFEWNNNYSKDTIDTYKQWEEVYEYDEVTGETKQVKNTLSESPEIFKTTKIPISIPKKVKTLFGDYNYSVREDVVIKDTGYSNPYIVEEEVSTKEVFDKYVNDYSKPIYYKEDVLIVKKAGTYEGDSDYKEYSVPVNVNNDFDTRKTYNYIGEDGDYYVYEYNRFWLLRKKLYIPKYAISEGEVGGSLEFARYDVEEIPTGEYEQKKKYKTITITKRIIKKTKQKIVEDIANDPKLNFEPTKFITYLNQNNLKVDDLELVREILLNVPTGNYLLDNIDRIISGSYGDIGNSGGGSGVTNPADMSGFNTLIPLFIQWDSRWANYPYAGETVGIAGCAITSTSMVLSGLGADLSGELGKYDKNRNGILEPDEVADYSTEHNHAAWNQGTYQSLYADIGAKAGIKITQSRNFNEVYEALGKGKVVITSVGPGTFTNASHLIVLTGLNSSGQITVNDPNSKEKSKAWDKNVISSEADAYFIAENPRYVTESFVATAYYAFTWDDAAKIGTQEAIDEATLQGGNNSTASGLYVLDKDLRDKIIAVDRNKIPLKSKVFINYPSEYKNVKLPDGTTTTTDGWYSAEDTGGAINENRIDVYMGAWGRSPQYKDLALKFGRRNVTLRYLKR